MALVVKDRVRETSVTQGTGTFTLDGAVTGYQSFSAIGNGNTTYYTIYLQASNEWEVGIGTYTASGTTLSRDTILASSNGGSVVNFSAGTKDVFVTYPAGRSVYYDTATNVTVNQLSATTVDATNIEVTNIKAKDGTAALSIADSTGVVSVSANPILSGGTANGVVYLNASKVATSGSALTFDGTNLGIGEASPDTRLHIYGASAAGRGQFYIQGSGTTSRFVMANSADAYSLNTYGDSSTSLLTWDTNSGYSFRWTIFDSEQMRLTTTGLGIGTDAPSTRVHAVGDNVAFRGQLSLQTSTASNFAQLTFYDRTTLGAQIYQGYQATAGLGDINIVNAGAAGINFWTTNTNRMTLDASGNLGLGVTPSGWTLGKVLQVGTVSAFWDFSNNTYLTNNRKFESGNKYIANGYATSYEQSEGKHLWLTAASGTANSTTIVSGNQYTIVTAGGNFTAFGAANNNVGTVFIATSSGTASGGAATQSIVFTQAMTLDASGNLLVGNTSNFSVGETNTVQAKGPFVLAANNTGSASNRNWLMSANSSGAGNLDFVDSATNTGWPNNAYRMTLTSSGNLGIGTTSPTGKLQIKGTVNFEATNSTNVWNLYTFTDNTLRWNYNGVGADELTLDSSGNLGLGVEPSAWGSSYRTMQLGISGLIYGQTGNTSLVGIGANFYNNGVDRYINSAPASLNYQYNGAYYWLTSTDPTPTAGNPITFNQAMTLDASGRLLINTGGAIYTDKLGNYTNSSTPLTFDVTSYYKFMLGATQAMTLDASGNLGLGTTTLTNSTGYSTFSLNGSTGGQLAFQTNGTGKHYIFSTSTDLSFYNSVSGNLIFSTSSTERARITSVGGFETRPAATGHAVFNEDGVDADFRVESDTDTHCLFVDASGNNVGIGTNAPAAKLHITGNGSVAGARVDGAGSSQVQDFYAVRNGSSTIQAGPNLTFQNPAGGTTYATTIQMGPTSELLFFNYNGSTWNERARITSGGDFLTGGKTSVGFTTSGAELRQDGLAAFIRDASSATLYVVKPTATHTTGNMVEFRYNDSTTVGTISYTSSSVAYNTSSDYRLKDNQQPLTGSGDFIDALKPKTWDWKAGGKGVGFIAHEVQAVSPGSVVGEKDAVDEDGNPIMQAMEYGSAEFIANIIAELQSLRARVAQLEAKGA